MATSIQKQPAQSAVAGRLPYGSTTPFSEPQWYRNIPSPYYNESHEKLRKWIRAFAEEHLMDVAYEWEEETKVVDPAVYRKMGDEGILRALAFGRTVPDRWTKNNSGTVLCGIKAKDWDGFHDMILIDELHRHGSLGVGQGLMGGLQIGCPPIYHYGSEELQQRVLPDILSGKKRLCLAITEPEAGSDVKNLSCEAKKTPDGKHYIVNGVKKWITNGVYSDWFTCAVRTQGKAGDAHGITILLIPKTDGVKCSRMLMSGQWCAGTTLVNFEDVRVPVENVIGEEHQGFKLLLTNFNHERLMIVYVSHRLARVCIEDAIEYASQRRVFGKPLIESEVIRMKLAHMSRLVEAQQSWIESIVYAIDNLSHEEGNTRLGGITSLMKASCSLTLEEVARDAVQILGGIGHTRGGRGERIERIRRDVKGVAIPGGSEEVMLLNGIKSELRLASRLQASLAKL